MPLLAAAEKASIASLNTIVMISLSTKEFAAFLSVSMFGVTLKTDHFHDAQLSKLHVFITAFQKLRFHSGAM